MGIQHPQLVAEGNQSGVEHRLISALKLQRHPQGQLVLLPLIFLHQSPLFGTKHEKLEIYRFSREDIECLQNLVLKFEVCCQGLGNDESRLDILQSIESSCGEWLQHLPTTACRNPKGRHRDRVDPCGLLLEQCVYLVYDVVRHLGSFKKERTRQKPCPPSAFCCA